MSKAITSTPIQVIKRVWERIAPLRLADTSWDNVGVMIEAPFPEVSKRQVLLTIDLTTAVCDEALELPSCSVIVAYHPPSFTLNDPIQTSLLRLAAKGISVFSPHTSLDATPNGINTWLVKPFESNTQRTKTITDSPEIDGFEGAGMGKIVHLKQKVSVLDIVKQVKEHLNIEHVQLATPPESPDIRSIAVCAGSGASMFKNVTADLCLTGEMSHHEVLAAVAGGSSVVLCNHTNTERGYLRDVLRSWLEEELNKEKEDKDEEGGQWEVVISKEDRDPLRVV